MSLKHAILGFLSHDSLSGYDLKKAFDQSVQHFWPANQSQIYRTLAELHERGLVEQEIVEREERLDMKMYHVTPEGREELHRWLSTTLPPRDVREAFLIQIYFGATLRDDELVALLDQEMRAIEGQLSAYESMYEPYQGQIQTSDDPRALFMKVLTLECGIHTARASLAWLRSVAARITSGDYTLKEFSPSPAPAADTAPRQA